MKNQFISFCFYFFVIPAALCAQHHSPKHFIVDSVRLADSIKMTDDSVQADMMKKEAEQKFLDEELKKQCLEKENRLMYQRRNSISIIVIAVIIISLVIVGLIILIVVLSGRK